MNTNASPLDTFPVAPSNPQATELDKHLDDVQKGKYKNKKHKKKVKRKAKKLKKKEQKWKRKLKKCQKEIRRLSLANVHLDQQLDFFQGNLEEIRLRYQAEAQRDCYRAMTLALSKRLGLEDSVPQIALLPPEKED